jgi:acetyl esterase/lipase
VERIAIVSGFRRMLGMFIAVGLLGLVACGVGAPGPAGPTVPASLPPGADIQPGMGGSFMDQVYCSVDGEELAFDLSYPLTGEGPFPLVVYVHGGAWRMGDKGGGAGLAFKPALLEAGYAFAAINYRLAPAHPFPAQIQDVQCALRFFRAHASLLAVDPQRFAAIGGSAGGHLVSLLGLTTGEGIWPQAGPYQGVSSEVHAVVDLFGPTDLRFLAEPAFQDVMADVFGEAVESEAALWEYSPLAHVTPEAPPFLILHGDADPVVPLGQSQALYEALLAEGVPVELVVVQNGGHSNDLFLPKAHPGPGELTRILLAFLENYLTGD